MKLPITRETDRLGDVADQVAASRGPRGGRAPSIAISRIRSSWSAIRFGVKPLWKSALRRSCFGGSMPMNIARASSIGKVSANTVTPPSSEE